MSHSTVIVAATDHVEALAPFDENIEMEPYTRYSKADLIRRERERIESTNQRCYRPYLADKEKYVREHAQQPAHLVYLIEEFPQRLEWTDEQCYAEAIKYSSPDELDPDGGEISTYNPKSKWDWYSVGGRWDGGLVTVDGRCVNVCRRGELDFERTQPSFAVLIDGEWHERATMGWFGIEYDEKVSKDEWPDVWAKLLADVPADMTLTLVDVHI